MVLRGKKKETETNFYMTIFVEKYDKHTLKTIERKLRKILKKNLGNRIKTNLYFETVKRYVLDEISARIYIKSGCRIYTKTIIDVLGCTWEYEHFDHIDEIPRIECYEYARWGEFPNGEMLLHPAVIGASFFDITDIDLSKKEILPLSLIKAGRTVSESIPKTLKLVLP